MTNFHHLFESNTSPAQKDQLILVHVNAALLHGMINPLVILSHCPDIFIATSGSMHLGLTSCMGPCEGATVFTERMFSGEREQS